MRSLILLLLLFITTSCCLATEKITWIKSSDIEKNGYYRNSGFTHEPIQIGLIMETNPSTRLRYLKINNPHVNNIILSQLHGDTLYRTGDFLPFNSRPVYFWDFVLPMPASQPYTDSLLLTIDNSGETQVFFLELLKEQAFEKVKSRDTFMYGGLLAYALFFSALFITLGWLRKNKNNILFGFFVILSMLWIFNIEGVLYQFLWSNNIFFQHASRVFFSSLTIGTFILYFIHYYQQAIHPLAKKFFYAFAGFFGVRLTTVLLLPGIRLDNGPKYILLFIGTLIIIIGLVLMLFYLIILFRKKELFYHNLGSAICFLFILKEGLKLTGIDLSPVPKQDDYVSIVTLLFILGTISVDNIRSYQREKQKRILNEIQESARKNKEMSDRILEAQENERSSIGKDIHDQIGGLLAAIKIQLETMKVRNNGQVYADDAEKLISMIDKCTSELYGIVDDLAAPEFDEQDLSIIIQHRISLYEQSTGICFDFDPIPLPINMSAGLGIYRIICELITNSIRHAQCQRIILKMEMKAENLRIHYEDDGIGFNITHVKFNHGIKNINSRLGFMNGSMNSSSQPGKTVFTINIPIV